MDEITKILIVDDRPENLLAIEGVLDQPGLTIITATTGNEALGLVLEHDFALVLLDVQMPGMDGFEVAQLMRGSEKTRHVPIIFLTAISKEDTHVFAGYEKGAVDYLFKPLDPMVLRSKVNVFVTLHRQQMRLERSNEELQKMISDLEEANQKVQAQQKAIVQEERLKVLLEMAGATAHELNQPLMVLMGNIQLIEMDGGLPEKQIPRIEKISEAAGRMARIVKQIQTIRHDEPRTYTGGQVILNLDQKISILSIDDDDEDFTDIEQTVKGHSKLSLNRSTTIQDALERLEKDRLDMILMEYRLPDGTALEFLESIISQAIEIPVVVITDQGDELAASRVIKAGAYDYLPKNKVTEESLLRIISHSLEKAGFRREMRMAQEKLAELSVRDELTGLFNRRYFQDALSREISGAKRYDHNMALCMFDLDHFKRVNDTKGHLFGDQVLREFGKLLIESIRQYDVACRYGGEEFALILPDTTLEEAVSLCERFRQRVEANPFYYGDLMVHITTSVGVAERLAVSEITDEKLIEMADKALYQAKERGRNRVVAL